MNTKDIVEIICLVFIGIILISLLVVTIIGQLKTGINMKDHKSVERLRKHTFTSEIVEQSNAINDYIIKVSNNIAILKWQEYIDNHDVEKLTREQLKNLASECAKMIINMINLDNIDHDNLLCTLEYTTFLIVNTTFNCLKRLSDNAINDLSE